MKVFSNYIVSGSIAFTFSTLLCLFFSMIGIFPPFTNQLVINLFIVSLIVLSFIFIINRLPIESFWFICSLELLSVFAALLLAGFLFDLFPFDFINIAAAFTIGIISYVIVVILVYFNHSKSAQQINKVIQQKNKG